jgi:hypothetical protein
VTLARSGSMHTDRYFHKSVTLPDGTILVAGGHHAVTDGEPSAEIFDPVARGGL